uniref:ShKT domain-containing protein n=1 Tax=Caenorhabditis tropicalis TaxID=1561998 RepID=A0A1I7UM71_9PELO
MNFYLTLLLSLFISTSTSFALPQCADGVTCPTGGLWSEWITNDTCSTTCGSCSKMYYKRTCLSEKSNCNCTGDAFRYLPCNTKSCDYPAQRSCCIPYVPMVINGTMQCGPIPKDPVSTKNSSCCPINGMWSEWTGFSFVSNQWIKTRECLSEPSGCPCNGTSNVTQTSCPCNALQSDQSVATKCAGDLKWQSNSFKINDQTCVLTATMVASNDDVVACHPLVAYQNYTFVPYVTFSTPSSDSCPYDRPWNCEARKENGQDGSTLDITFSCDLETLQWLYDYDGTPVNGYVQILYSS